MAKESSKESVELIDNTTRYDLDQFCRLCHVERVLIVRLVEEGVIEVEGDSPEHWVFSFRTVKRLKRVYRLQRDLDLNIQGVALSADLLEEIDRLRDENSRLRSHLNLYWQSGDPVER